MVPYALGQKVEFVKDQGPPRRFDFAFVIIIN